MENRDTELGVDQIDSSRDGEVTRDEELKNHLHLEEEEMAVEKLKAVNGNELLNGIESDAVKDKIPNGGQSEILRDEESAVMVSKSMDEMVADQNSANGSFEYIEDETDTIEDRMYFINILKRLDLEKFYNKRITLIRAITLRNAENLNHNIGFRIIHNLLTASHKAHFNELSVKEGDESEEKEIYHPMDIMNVIYNCCDPILQQVLFNKMLSARLAIPFLIPNVMEGTFNVPLRSLQGVVPEWKIKDQVMFGSLVDIKQPIISFMRISNLSRSKSEMLNDLLSDNQPDSFFHRNCTGGYAEKQLSKGSIEFIYNLPHKDGRFKEFFCILNLRGNCLDHDMQRKLLIDISSMIVLFVNENDIKSKSYESVIHYAQEKKLFSLICLISDETKPGKSKFEKEITAFDKKMKTFSEIIFIKDRLEKRIMNSKEFNKLITEHITNVYNQSTKKAFTYVKMFSNCLNISTYSEEVLGNIDIIEKSIEPLSVVDRKETLLRSQSKYWPEIAKLMKELKTKKTAENLDKVAAETDAQIKKLRISQMQFYSKEAKFIKNVILFLQRGKRSDFINLCQLKLNFLSKACLPPMQSEYFSINEEYYKCKNDSLKDILLKKAKTLEINLIRASFGMEHVMREIGQVYESWYHNKEQFQDAVIANLPMLAAEILLEGLPLEIMDGDNACVALQWILAVLKCLKNKIGNKKLLVVSVIGVQSSGKSTMLNSMFGLQFSVSAGRCTKGVYCSLIPVDSQYNNMGYEYVLVIDTEGLRAPELSESNNKTHDNELATFVIGLGDITIINIKGENYSEMQDVLEIVVHALIRITRANPNMIKPQCIFVHQNVSGANVEDDLRSQQQLLRKRLDKITYLAAEKEKNLTINEFNDIIAFDSKDCFYVPDLWQGTKPMLYVSESYIKKIEEIRNIILTIDKKTSLSSFTAKLHDLWQALSKEDFVFSFRNSEELHSYSKLDEKMASLSWEITNKCAEVKQGCITKLNNCSLMDNLSEEIQCQKTKCSQSCLKIKNDFINELKNYFENSEEKNIIIMWQSRSEKSLELLIEREQLKIESALDRAYKSKVVESKNDNEIKLFRYQFTDKAKEVATNLRKENVSKDEVVISFNKIWNEFLKKLLVYEVSKSEDWNCLKFIMTKYLEPFFTNKQDLYDRLEMEPFQENDAEIEINTISGDDLITICDEVSEKTFQKFKKWLSSPFTKDKSNRLLFLTEANQNCIDVDNKIMQNIHNLSGTDFDETHIYRSIFLEFRQLFEDGTKQYVFNPIYIEKFVLRSCRKYISKLMDIKSAFRMENDQKKKIEKDESLFFELFQATYHQRTTEITQTEMIYKLAIKWVENSIKGNLSQMIANDVKYHEACMQSKRSLIEKVLIDLNDNDDFDGVMKFIREKNEFLICKINDIAGKYLSVKNVSTGQTNLETLILKEILEKKKLIQDAFKEAATKSKKSYDIVQLVKKNNDTFVISDLDVEIFKDYDQGIENFSSLFNNLMNKFEHNCLDKFPFNDSIFEKFPKNFFCNVNSGELLANGLLGCKEECPFCRNICDFTVCSHIGSHKCFLHIPQGIRGVHWAHTCKLLSENCTTCVDSTFTIRLDLTPGKTDGITFYPYKDYKTFFPDWDIPPDSSLQASLYWKRFFGVFNHKIANYHGLKPADLPNEWVDTTKSDVNESLKSVY